MYSGVFRAGKDSHYLWAGASWSSFVAKWKELSKKNLRLIDIETYTVGGNRKWVGVFRAGKDSHYLWDSGDWENFVAKWKELSKKNLRLIDIEVRDGECSDSCTNQVINPEGAYNYPIKNTTYRWPVDEINKNERYVRLSALYFNDQPFTLPFSDKKVKQNGTWRYGSGVWHHAIDYSNGGTFEVKAAADGRVIHIGYDPWSGGTIVMSHDVGKIKDAFRTVYMHLRNGPLNDCKDAWNKTIPTLMGKRLSQYKDYLNKTGCPKNGPYNPKSKYWGTDSDVIDRNLLGKKIRAGTFLANAGNTGPGGCNCTSEEKGWKWSEGHNIHLHIFFARRDLTNNKWYFIDPYGIYSLPKCYPSKLTDPIKTPCSRYPIAWKGNRPRFAPSSVTSLERKRLLAAKKAAELKRKRRK